MLNHTLQVLTDFPKIECPFVRKMYSVNEVHFKKYGSQLKLREHEVYLVTDEVNPGYEWVFEDPDTIAVEKLDGTNVKLKTENGRLIALQNRKNVLDPLQILKGKSFIIEGIFLSIQKGYVEDNKEQAGEVIGPKLQGNPYQLENHEWYPFEKSIKHLRYCKERDTLWKKIIKSQPYTCLGGIYVGEDKRYPYATVKVKGWVFDKIKTKKDYDSYFDELEDS